MVIDIDIHNQTDVLKLLVENLLGLHWTIASNVPNCGLKPLFTPRYFQLNFQTKIFDWSIYVHNLDDFHHIETPDAARMFLEFVENNQDDFFVPPVSNAVVRVNSNLDEKNESHDSVDSLMKKLGESMGINKSLIFQDGNNISLPYIGESFKKNELNIEAWMEMAKKHNISFITATQPTYNDIPPDISFDGAASNQFGTSFKFKYKFDEGLSYPHAI